VTEILCIDLIDHLKIDKISIDILVNNAGIILRTPVAQHSDEDWDKVLSVNLDAPFILTREIGKSMLKKETVK
jgi:2-dehydro-3-deoxy-D-gluconate 5-dehydrogenase